MKAPIARSKNQTIQQQQKENARRRLQKNIQATEEYVKKEYPNEKWIANTAQLQAVNQYTKNLVLPKNVKVAESRIPVSQNQKNILDRELKQAGILSRLGNSVYLIPERGVYGERLLDATVNGKPYEFRTTAGNARTFEGTFRDAKGKGKDINVFVSIESSKIDKAETRRKINLVLKDHPEYTGKIIISFKGGKTYFWDSSNFRQ
jgi:hypothetical protein